MTAALVLQAAGALLVTLALLVGGAWTVRRAGLALPSPARSGPRMLARLPGRRSIVRVSVEGRVYDILLAPDHSVVLHVTAEPGA